MKYADYSYWISHDVLFDVKDVIAQLQEIVDEQAPSVYGTRRGSAIMRRANVVLNDLQEVFNKQCLNDVYTYGLHSLKRNPRED